MMDGAIISEPAKRLERDAGSNHSATLLEVCIMAPAILTQARLRELLHYDPETGVFTWLINRPRVTAGDEAGSLYDGYVRIKLDQVLYRAHRLAWLYVTGEWPQEETDHKNGDRADNKFTNLRPASKNLNQQNRRRPQKDNKLGVLGVRMVGGKFLAQIHAGGKVHHIGTYDTAELAHSAYLDVKRKVHLGCTI